MKLNSIWLKHTATFGVILGLSLCMVEFAALLMGMVLKPIMFNFFVFLTFITQYIAVRNYREHELKGIINFGEVFISGLMVSATAGLIWAIYRFFQYTYSPGLIEEIIRVKKEAFTSNSLAPDQLEMYLKLVNLLTTPFILAAINTFFVSMIVGGSFLSLILGLILKRSQKRQIGEL